MKSARRRSREFALQGMYAWLLAGQEANNTLAQFESASGYERADRSYLEALLRGAIERHAELEAVLAPCLDRKVSELSPVERAILLLGAWELKYAEDVPLRVVINEAVELAKSYGGTDGHKYVNGVLDRMGRLLRVLEEGARA